MRPENQFTSPETRFFFPFNNEAEHHTSVDTSEFPSVVHVEGEDHYVILSKDGEEHAVNPWWGHPMLPEGATVTQIAGVASWTDRKYMRDYLEGAELEDLDRERNSYVPGEDDKVIVRLKPEDTYRAKVRGNTNIPEDGIFFLPKDQPLPTAEELGITTRDGATYEFIGFINAKDQLVLANRLYKSPVRKVVDWCVANRVAQNALEFALLRFDLPNEARLTGLIDVEPSLKAYLKYFDDKRGTNFFPEVDPIEENDRFRDMTPEQRDKYHFLTDAAYRFMTQPRYPR